ncbi:MAG: c-type cytochrome [Anaerolineae bacterium]|nr:c-type cytochrome [Anaerolineae bacterium]
MDVPYLLFLCLGTPMVFFLVAVMGVVLASLSTSFSKTRRQYAPAGQFVDQFDERLIKEMQLKDKLSREAAIARLAARPIYADDRSLFLWFSIITFAVTLWLLLNSPGEKNVFFLFMFLSVIGGAAIAYILQRYNGLVDLDLVEKLEGNDPRLASIPDITVFGFFAAAMMVAILAAWVAAPPARNGRPIESAQANAGKKVLVAKATATPVAAAVGADGLPVGSPARGKVVFNGPGTCNACHSIVKDQKLVGPSLAGAWAAAATRKPSMSAKDYMRESIVSPGAFVVDGYPAGVMPATFGESLSKQQLADLLAYLENDLK